jgi:predicted lactoylglutathione lyase
MMVVIHDRRKEHQMTSIQSVTLEVPDPQAAEAFYGAAFDLGGRLGLRASEEPTSGFRAFTLSLVVSQPANVDELVGAALHAGATALKPAKKSLWGYGGTVQAPDGAIWKVATSKKKNAGPATRKIEQLVLLLGVADVPASKQFYVDRGLSVARSFARAYVEFDTAGIKLGLYKRRALAKDAGVSPDGSGSHRLAIVSDARSFTDPDGFAWEAARVDDVAPSDQTDRESRNAVTSRA